MMLNWLKTPPPSPDPDILQQARKHQAQLTKPPGSLGQLEQVAVQLAALQRRRQPNIEPVQVSLFAGDHGIVTEAVSAFPQAVTGQMLHNFINGGAAASVLSRFNHARLEVIDCGIINPVDDPRILQASAGAGTANFLHQAAMTEKQLEHALQTGRQAALRAARNHCNLFIGGEMGIGNTSAATAMACALLHKNATQLTGAGTGLNTQQQQHKAAVIQQALDKHNTHLTSAQAILRYLGGFEIAALVGAYLSAAQQGMPVLVDGFICTAAALCGCQINPLLRDWLLFSHCSDEAGHIQLLEALEARPLLHLGLRLGEASGALAALPLLQMACQLHNNMATFSQAQVSTQALSINPTTKTRI